MGVSESIVADVCVGGGGPAGATVAQRLASFGYDVCLVERQSFPRHHVGASLPSTILPLLDVIGARELVERAGFLRPRDIIVWWGDASPTIRHRPEPPGFHVDRGEFDRLLLQHARRNGVRVVQPANALRPERSSNGGWKTSVHHGGLLKQVTSRILIDASGGRALIPGRRKRVSAPLLALYAHWRTPSGEIAGRVEAGADEWYWYAPLGGGRSVAAVFIDPKRLSDTSMNRIEGTYRDLLGRARLFRDVLVGDVEGPVLACDASTRCAEEPATSDFVRVGDANLSVDPLSGQGVQLAIASGIQAAAVVNTILRNPANSEIAVAFYRDRQKERIQQYAAKTAELYSKQVRASDRPFWRTRAASAENAPPFLLAREKLDDNSPIQLSDSARIKETPAIRGDMIALASALHHRSLNRPVVYFDEIEMVPLLRQVKPGETAREIIQTWSKSVSREHGWRILQWLWDRGILSRVQPSENSRQFSNSTAQ